MLNAAVIVALICVGITVPLFMRAVTLWDAKQVNTWGLLMILSMCLFMLSVQQKTGEIPLTLYVLAALEGLAFLYALYRRKYIVDKLKRSRVFTELWVEEDGPRRATFEVDHVSKYEVALNNESTGSTRFVDLDLFLKILHLLS